MEATNNFYVLCIALGKTTQVKLTTSNLQRQNLVAAVRLFCPPSHKPLAGEEALLPGVPGYSLHSTVFSPVPVLSLRWVYGQSPAPQSQCLCHQERRLCMGAESCSSLPLCHPHEEPVEANSFWEMILKRTFPS